MSKKSIGILAMVVICIGQSSAAETALSVNGESAAEIEAGTPIIVSATVTDSADVGAPEWRLTVRDPSGAPARVEVVLRRKQDPKRVGPFSMCSAIWTIGPEVTAALPFGEYSISIGDSKPARVRIKTADTTEDAEKKTARLLLGSEFAELTGKLDEALERADALLSFDATSVAGRLRKSDVLAAKGDLSGALSLLDEAEQLSKRRFPDSHPPILIMVRQEEMLARMEAQGN